MESEDLNTFWEGIPNFFEQLYRNYATDNLETAEVLADKISDYLDVIRVLYGRVSEHYSDPSNSLSELLQHLIHLLNALESFREHFETISLGDSSPLSAPDVCCPTARNGSVGRPPYEIDKEQVLYMAELGFTFQSMAKCLGVSVRTLRRRRQQLGMPIGGDIFHHLTDLEVDEQVTAILRVGLIHN